MFIGSAFKERIELGDGLLARGEAGMEREEDLWLKGDALRFDLDEAAAPSMSWIRKKDDAKDMIWTSVIIGLLSAIVPWWTGLNLVLALMTSSWLLVLGAVLFITGTVINLRNPAGTLAQLGGLAFFGLEIAFRYLNHHGDSSFDLGGPEIGLALAFISVGISFLVIRLGGYDRS